MTTVATDHVRQQPFEIPFPPKAPISCIRTVAETSHSRENSGQPSLIFTHGAGGTLKTEAVAHFANGFAKHAPIVCFQGSMNLKSRVKMFEAVCEHQKSFECLGGRSMGARAAVMAVSDKTTHLVLVSYPLHTEKETRDKILLDLPEHMRVIFVSGSRDNMCDINRLEQVRKKMKCKSWLCVVKDADHGMSMKPKAASQGMIQKTGEIVASWLQDCDSLDTVTSLFWNADTSDAELDAGQGQPEEAPADLKRKRSHSEPDEKMSETRSSKSSSRRKRRK